MKIIFMGSSDFSLPSFKSLYENGYQIQALYTKKPKPNSRGKKIKYHEIYNLAKELNIPIFTPVSLKKQEAIEEFLNIDADINIVASYGLILPKEVLYAKKYKSINVHGSILPKHRGAAPIQRAIENGDNTIGVTIMQMDEGIDTGDIIATNCFKLTDSMEYEEIFNKTAKLGAKLLINVLQNINDIKTKKQNESQASYASMITKEESFIDFNDTAFNIFNKIRAFSYFPKMQFKYENETIKVLKASYSNNHIDAKPGQVLNKNLTIATKKGTINPLILQRAGKKALNVNDFTRGFCIKVGSIL